MTQEHIKWTVEETIWLTNYVIDRDGELPEGDELNAVRNKFFPRRTTDSVYMQAWDIQAALGYDQRTTAYSAQIRAVAKLFSTDPGDMARLAHDIESLWQIRHYRPVAVTTVV